MGEVATFCRFPLPAFVRLLRSAILAGLLVPADAARAGPHAGAATESQGRLQRALAVNRLSLQLRNAGWFATDVETWSGGLEFPRGSGKLLGFAGGLWFSGRTAGSLRTAITEYGTEFVPGPGSPGGLEVQLTAYAFNRSPVLQDVVFLHYRIVHRGSETLDSTYIGLWYDADTRSASIPAGSDSSLDLAYVYRTTDDAL